MSIGTVSYGSLEPSTENQNKQKNASVGAEAIKIENVNFKSDEF